MPMVQRDALARIRADLATCVAVGGMLAAFACAHPVRAADSTVAASNKPTIVVIGTGGTIAGAGKSSTDTSTYATAAVGVDTIVQAVPELAAIANVRSEQVFQVGSKSINDDLIIKLAKRVNEVLKRDDVAGVVVTHGTDTLEESAYFLNLTVKTTKPIVFAASMRPSTALSADGPLNLFDAVVVASSKEAAGKGVLITMNDEIHTARDIVKTNTFKTDTFKSPYGPLGYVVEGKALFYRNTARRHTGDSEFDIETIDRLPRVDITYSYSSSDAAAYNAFAAAGTKAIVNAGTGNGNVSDSLVEPLGAIRSRGVFVVRASRTGSGTLYRGPSFQDDDKRGWIAVDDQTAPKARLLMALGLTKTQDVDALRALFTRY
ncbi:asparaginase [Rhodoplanes sp.]|uniref:asparaginase n=1 Tax=Rhodoplanes sp. TaxID=1968906 RepID=UPI0025D4649F|nr:asparaginase [Rhodoplanes sp.]